MWELLQSFLLLKNIVPTNPNKGTSQKVSLKINFSKIQCGNSYRISFTKNSVLCS
ncbi:hypothetical protein LEP1GSC127_0945 [Leptospira kirschneri str. 200801925]|uniref:Uncharacterized protein n=1 Tax=Leptospira kirschneri str. 200802841 TaxID=1193047 RepID=A0A828Y0C0_9LEPT|nr:hypothetical protein LEP1GSC044_2450 [Leptospira kirschneri serovar Grippotyphosa str. RM52]EKO52978.1 hypothetical protein LEP1GSC131_2182 [Leptospira kirschneri str. 200802841]EKQ81850.1 hypothetical protein LEP1GSC064_0042 [Leptospira kirschneri serovar Grippotyphosa str. Moskva]EKR09866.1 hypothetical protein LEP1GSC122_3060 [Leptospira kirschneri serovar Valbuzzi str. 200702274]EMJ99253.1 hypothetical protein LEP1GSC176_1614 [Leptospira kirschneri str. MMD1493]EMN25520.1 hypothetical p